MRRSFSSIFIVVLMVVTFTALGARAEVINLSLDEAITKAMTANYHIQSLEAGTKAQEGLAKSEKNRWMGELFVNGGVALHGDDTLIRPITQEMMMAGPIDMPFDDQYAFWNLAYRIPLYGGGSVTGMRESSKLSAQASAMSTRRAILATRHKTLATYVNILSLEAQQKAWSLEQKALNLLVQNIELGQKAGKYSRIDLLKTKVKQQNVVMKTEALKLAYETSYASLLSIMGETQAQGVHYKLMPVDLAVLKIEPTMFSALVDSALIHRSDLQAMKKVAAAKRFNVSVVNGGRRPQVSVGGNFSGTHGGTIDFDDTFWSVNATVSMPLLDMGRRKGLTNKADMTARSAELDVLDMEGKIRAEVTAAMAAVTNASVNITTQQTTLELATEVNRLEQLRYDSGRGDIDNLLEAQSGQSMATATLAEARHNLLIALNNLQLTIEGECR